MSSSATVRLLIVLALATAAGAALWGWGSRSGPEKEAAWVNANQSSAKLVGNQSCLECHAEIADTYQHTGHAHTFELTRDSVWARKLDGQTYEDPERDLVYHYHFNDITGLSVSVPARFGAEQFPLKYALGSNLNAKTFLQLIPNMSGGTAGIEHRVSIFGESGQLGLTPSHKNAPMREDVETFGRVVEQQTVESCVGCHTLSFEIQNHDLVNVVANVGCENCHGPGSQHASNMHLGLKEMAIDSLRPQSATEIREQIDTCGECHRSPQDLRPEDIYANNSMLARFQPVGLINSECFQKSAGMLSCSECHHPHEKPAKQLDQIISSCLKCHSPHEESKVACPVSPEQNCIECHMPPVEIHRGITFHDHWIRVREQAREDAPQ